MAAYIHHGPWINWSHGLIQGATITLGDRDGGLLTAFIATFVTIVGAQLWKIICYTSHQLRSTPTPQDGLYHQQQVILKNTTGPAGTAWVFLQQTWCWADRCRKPFLRTLPWVVFGAAYVGAIGVIAIFSSQISKSPGPMRLIFSDDCGTWLLNTSSPYEDEAFLMKSVNDSLVAATYAKACYGGNYDPLVCGRFPVSSISWTADQNATCPFQSGTCLYGDTAAYKTTSKLIDSHTDLGINAPLSDRIQVEKATTCAPLHTAPFVKIVNATEAPDLGRDNDTILEFYYGELLNTTNLTYWYNDHASFDQYGYTLSAVNAAAGQALTNGTFIPVQAVNTTDADLSLLFIAANSVIYTEPCDDPVFAAHDLVDAESLGLDVRYYNPDRYVNVLGCAEQYRICNPNNNACTKKLGIMQMQNAVAADKDGLLFNSVQNATAIRMIDALQVTTVYYQTFTRLGGALRATETLHTLTQRYLPPDQWHIEAGSWFDTGLARLQQKTQEYATGPAVVPRGSYVLKPNPTVHPDDLPWQAMCYSQMINDSSDTMSFSVIGLAILFAIGTIIIFISLTMEFAIGWLQVRFAHGLHAQMEWQVNDTLQLQSLLHKEMNLGQWDDSKRLPVTLKNEKFLGPADKHLNLKMNGQSSDFDDETGAKLVQ